MDCTTQCNIRTAQRFQKKTLSIIVNAPWGADLYTDLDMDFVTNKIRQFTSTHKERLNHNIEPFSCLKH